ncbi:hypothetical protein CBOM_03640 [Ceraceosorus bombacis]|uniref:Uncharacterized protein n=1 Tax=Ceraceosorus bombacis TaxID=401625 RepID=A0A0P1BGZ8_9BASI|nr:hypothetical protein CBOM_03640 [Ceraceosorus bombacis]
MPVVDWASPPSIASSPSTPTSHPVNLNYPSWTSLILEPDPQTDPFAAAAAASRTAFTIPEPLRATSPRIDAEGEATMPVMCAPSPSSVCSSPSFGPASPAASHSRRPSTTSFGKRRSIVCMQLDRDGSASQQGRPSASSSRLASAESVENPSHLKRKRSSISNSTSNLNSMPMSADRRSPVSVKAKEEASAALTVEQLGQAAAAGRVKLTDAQRASIARLVVAQLKSGATSLPKRDVPSDAMRGENGQGAASSSRNLGATRVRAALMTRTSASASSPSTRTTVALAVSSAPASTPTSASATSFGLPFAPASGTQQGPGEIPQSQRFRELSASTTSSLATRKSAASTTSAARAIAPFLARVTRRDSENVSPLSTSQGGTHQEDASRSEASLSRAPGLASSWASYYAGGTAWAEAALEHEARRMSGGADDGSDARRASRVDLSACYEQQELRGRSTSVSSADSEDQTRLKRARREGASSRRHTTESAGGAQSQSTAASIADECASTRKPSVTWTSSAHANVSASQTNAQINVQAQPSLVGVLSNFANLLEARAETCQGLEDLARQAQHLEPLEPLSRWGPTPSPACREDASMDDDTSGTADESV